MARKLVNAGMESYYIDVPLEVTHEGMRQRIKELEECLRVTRAIVCEGAKEGFNYKYGNWAERLYANNGAISKLVPIK